MIQSHRMTGAVVRASAVRAHDAVVPHDRPFDRRAYGEAARRRSGRDLDDARPLFVEQARMGDVSHRGHPVPSSDLLVQADGPDLARAAFGLRSSIDELGTDDGLAFAEQRDGRHDLPGREEHAVALKATDLAEGVRQFHVWRSRVGCRSEEDQEVPGMMSEVVFQPAPGAA